MATNPVAKIAVSMKLANGRIVTLREGDILKGLSYKDGTDIVTIDGAIRVINATAKTVTTSHVCLPEPYMSKMLTFSSIVVDMSTAYDAELRTIPIGNIIDVEDIEEDEGAIKVGTGSQYGSLTDIIAAAEENSIIELLGGTYEADINLNKSIKLISENGAIIKGNININGENVTRSTEDSEVNVVLDGLYLTGNSKINITGVDSFTMKNCVYTNHDFNTTRTTAIIIGGTTPVKVNIDNNTFGNENKNCYNIIEVVAPLKDDSTFNNNRFDKESCTHNQISLYGIVDDAVIEINDNHCEVSKNMIRLGFKGTPKGIVEMERNTYVESDTNFPEWSGLFLVQPHGMATESFAGLTIKVSNTKKPAGQLCYMYAGGKDTQFTEDNQPTIIVDGKTIVPVILTA